MGSSTRRRPSTHFALPMAARSPRRARPRLTPLAWAIRAAVVGALLSTAGLSVVHAQTPSEASAQQRHYDIPAGQLDGALSHFGRAAGIMIAIDPTLTAGLQSAGLRGSYSVEDGLAALLSGHALEAVAGSGGGYRLRRLSAPTTGGAAAGATATLPSVLVTAQRDAGPDQLPAAYAGGQVAKGARLGLLGNADVMDTPFTVTSYTAEVIEHQGARTIADVLRNDASVRFATSDGHPFENFRVRNFAVNQNEMMIDGMYGLTPYSHTPVEMFERVELLRGPSALFTGMAPAGALGGTINLVPKRAGATPLSRVGLDYVSDSQLGVRFDLARRVGPDDSVGVRINGSFADGDTALRGQSKQRQFLSAALDYRNGNFKASLDAYYSKEKFAGGTPAGVLFRNVALGVLPAPDGSVSVYPAAYGEAESKALIARGEYRINEVVTAYAGLGARNGTVKGFYTGSWITPTAASGVGTVSLSGQRMYEDNVNAEAGLRLNFRTGGIAHALTVQASRLKIDYGYAASSSNGVASMYDSVYVPMPVLPDAALKWSDKTFDSLALVDTLSMLDDRLRLTLGLRHQHYKVVPTADGISTGGEVAYDKSALTPALGVVFKPWGPALSLYGSYVQGLSQGGSISMTNGYTRNHSFAPFKTEQAEVGLKWNAGSFLNSFALYQITQPTLLSFTDSSGGLDATDGGEKRVRGIEWNSVGEPIRGLRVLGGLIYAQSIQTKTQGGALDGYPSAGAPRWQANLGLEVDVPGAPGLTLSGRMQASSRQWLTSNQTLALPGWAVFDLGARYATRLYGRPAALRLNITNVSNRSYYSGVFREGTPIATLGAPRTVMASVVMDF